MMLVPHLVPPLPERKDDIPALKYFVKHYPNQAAKNTQSIDKRPLPALAESRGRVSGP
jgi:transcriptional regulator with PAS, ATPase and Fis domain